MFIASRFWKKCNHHLGKMSLAELVKAYFAYPGIQIYIFLSLVGAGLTLLWIDDVWPPLAATALAILVYPLVWYLLHRFVLHGRFLYRLPITASLWKRIHFDHHRNPNDLRVLFGALYTTLPTIFVVTGVLGWMIGGPAASAAAITAGLVTTCVYEFCHCVQHLSYAPRSRFLKRVKKLHLAHHYHNERGNYGITNFFWDQAFGTYYREPVAVPRSDTTFTLGYEGEEARRYPWVARLSAPDRDPDAGRRRDGV